MILWTFSIKEIRRHPGRALLTLMSVVIGVATVVAVLSATRTTRGAYEQMFRTVNGRADLEVTAKSGGRFDEKEILDTVRSTPGVQTAVPLVRRNSLLYADQGRAKLTVLGIDPENDSKVRDYEQIKGHPLSDEPVVWLDVSLANRLQVNLGDTIKLLTRSGLKQATVVGLVRPTGGSTIAQGGLVFLSIRRAQLWFRIGLKVDSISVVLDDQADESTVRESLSHSLPDSVTVGRPVAKSEVTDEASLANEQALRLATGFLLLLAVFVITNTFAMNVGERRKQFAVMRAIGATRRQIAGVVYREALAMGLAGTALGMIAGVYAAHWVTTAVASSMMVELPAATVSGYSLVVAAAFGIGIAVLGAYLPARSTAKLTPMEALMAIAPRGKTDASRWLPWLGIALLAFATVLLASCIWGLLPVELSVVGAVVGLVGLVFMIPWAIAPLGALLEKTLFRSAPAESRLARRQMLRNPARTTLTIGVLFIAISTGIALANAISNNINDVQHWYRQAIAGDFFIRAMMPDMATGEAAGLPEGLRLQIREVDGVTDIDAIKFVSAPAQHDLTLLVVVREFQNDRPVYFDIQGDRPENLNEKLRQGQVVIGTVLAQREQLTTGDTIGIETNAGEKPFRIAAVANDYIGGGLTVYMDRSIAEPMLGVEGEDFFIIKCAPDQLRTAEAKLQKISDNNGLLLQSYADLTGSIQSLMTGIVASLRGLLVLGFLVASFGVINTLTMNVLEQTPELAMLRVIAMTRWQTRKVIFVQAAMMGLTGLIPGALAGLLIAYLINLSALPVLGHPVAFHAYPGLITGSLLAASVMILISAWIPAERAARIAPAQAMRND